MGEETFNVMAQKRIVYHIPGQEASARNIPLTFMNHPTDLHDFDLLNDDARSHEIICATLAFVRMHIMDTDVN